MSIRQRLQLGTALLFVAACSGAAPTDGGNNGGNNNPNPPGLPGGTPVANASVDVDNNLFTPNSVLLAVGGTVTWTWSGSGHSVTSDGAPGFTPSNSGVRNAPYSFAVTFPATGDYKYFCTVHGQAGVYSAGDMIGTVFVR